MVAKQKRKENTQARMKEEPTTLEKFQREPEAQRLGHQRNSSASQGVFADCGASEDWYISGVPPSRKRSQYGRRWLRASPDSRA